MFDLVSVGHFSIDSIFLPSRSTPFVFLGGSVTYLSVTARRLDARVSIVSKVGNDFLEAYRWWLSQEGVDLSRTTVSSSAETTRYELRYASDLSGRELRLTRKASPILVEDLPDSLRAEIVHIAPIDDEISFEVAEKLRSQASVVSFDPQGLLREFDQNGNVTLGPLKDTRILGLVDIYKSSSEETVAVTGRSDINSAVKAIHDHGVKIVIITQGSAGALVSVEDAVHNVPAFTAGSVVDPTGAGDAFMGGFLAEYARGESLPWCSCVGSAAASFIVESVGPTVFGNKNQVYLRARELYEKGIK